MIETCESTGCISGEIFAGQPILPGACVGSIMSTDGMASDRKRLELDDED
jgi:hypothetical protein